MHPDPRDPALGTGHGCQEGTTHGVPRETLGSWALGTCVVDPDGVPSDVHVGGPRGSSAPHPQLFSSPRPVVAPVTLGCLAGVLGGSSAALSCF